MAPGRPERDKTEDDIVDIEMPEIVSIAEAHNVHPAIICLAGGPKRANTYSFSVKKENYMNNLRAVIEDPLTEEEMEKIKGADKNCRLIKGQVFLWEGARGWEDLWDIDGTITK